MLATDGGEHSLLDVRHIVLETGAASGDDAAKPEPGDG
jgi:hypothetical protein